jgi:hypothetical protein
MEHYQIPEQVYKIARKLGVHICLATNPKYKIEVYDGDGIYITQLGARGYSDYFTFMNEEGHVVANKRRDAYLKRHRKELAKVGSRGWLSAVLLWNY